MKDIKEVLNYGEFKAELSAINIYVWERSQSHRQTGKYKSQTQMSEPRCQGLISLF